MHASYLFRRYKKINICMVNLNGGDLKVRLQHRKVEAISLQLEQVLKLYVPWDLVSGANEERMCERVIREKAGKTRVYSG